MSYVTITNDEKTKLRKRLAQAGYTDYLIYYEKCNVEPGMHASVTFDDGEDSDYALILSLYGNVGFVPNENKFEEIFGAIESPVGFFMYGAITKRI
ncbi:MAG: hypothetical protein LBF86_02340 [Helicobacteraceae bacterium]|nr:hypothetical protein [Helicobacteraceae bacterium]